MKDESGIRSCPFCGGDNQSVRETGSIQEPWEVFCHGSQERACDAQMWGESPERAVEEWNQRSLPSFDEIKHVPEVQMLIKALELYRGDMLTCTAWGTDAGKTARATLIELGLMEAKS